MTDDELRALARKARHRSGIDAVRYRDACEDALPRLLAEKAGLADELAHCRTVLAAVQSAVLAALPADHDDEIDWMDLGPTLARIRGDAT